MDSLAPLRRRLTDVTEYQLPRLLSGKLSRELGAEARADLESVRQALELKREEAEGPPLDRELLEAVDIIQTELDEAMKKYRAALVTAKKASRAEKERYELDEPVEQVEHVDVEVIGGEDAVQTKTNEVTDALRRTTQLLQTELERSVLSTQMLDESTRTLRSTTSLYDTYTNLLSTSSQLVKHLERADWWDRALLLLALSCFLLVVAYIVKRRVLDRVGGLVGWWVGGSYRLVKMAGGGGKAAKAVKAADAAKAVEVVTTVVEAVTTAVIPIVTDAAEAAVNRVEL